MPERHQLPWNSGMKVLSCKINSMEGVRGPVNVQIGKKAISLLSE